MVYEGPANMECTNAPFARGRVPQPYLTVGRGVSHSVTAAVIGELPSGTSNANEPNN